MYDEFDGHHHESKTIIIYVLLYDQEIWRFSTKKRYLIAQEKCKNYAKNLLEYIYSAFEGVW